MSDWIPPTEFPELRQRGAKILSLDLETRDPNLLTNGPGGVRGDGYIIGASIATEDFRGYFPVRHEDGGNLDRDQTFAWLRDQLSTDIPKVGANIIYDLEWLRAEGIEVRGPKYDVQVAEPLLDENRRSYALNELAKIHLGETKDETLLIQAAQQHYGIAEKEVKSNMWRMHSKYVGPYGEKDADLPLRIFAKQAVRLGEDSLEHCFYELETPLVDVLLDMRWNGVPVDIPAAEIAVAKLKAEQDRMYGEMCKLAGREVDFWSNVSIAAACHALGLDYTTTDKGNPSFEADWLSIQEHPFYQLLLKVRQFDRAGAVFIQSKIIDVSHNGKIFPRYRQVRGDDGKGAKGTRSGRFSSEGPNLQQVPARNEFLAHIVRSLFIARSGEKFGALDWSQQEPRVTVHYAFVRGFAGGEEARNRYISDPKTDYHQMTADMVFEMTGLRIDRKLVAKPMNLGMAYGMGRNKMAATLGLTKDRADPIFKAYHRALPYVKLLGDDAAAVAMDRGYIRTISGRRRHFDLFGPRGWKPGLVPKKYEEAVEEWGQGVVRYFTHKALNALIQGTSADMMKYAMVKLHQSGFTPLMTVHDELCFSLPSDEALVQAYDIMMDPMPEGRKISVPLQIDVTWGRSWSEGEEVVCGKSGVHTVPADV